MWWRRQTPDVSTGALFRRATGYQADETAEVLDVRNDRAGIPHVRYRLHTTRSNRPGFGPEERTLALTAFMQMYPERIGA